MDKDQTVKAVFKEEDDPENGYIPREPGEQTSHTTTGGLTFYMLLAPASIFPTGIDDDGKETVDYDFWVAETR